MSTLQTTFLKHPDAAGNQITFTSGGDVNFDNGAVYLDSTNDRLGIGTTPAQLLHLSSSGFPTIRVTDADNSTYFDITNSDGDIILKADEGNTFANSAIRFMVDGGEKFRCDASGRLLVGTSSSIETNSQLQVVGSNVNGSIIIARNDTSVANNQTIGRIQYYGNDDNGTYQLCAAIDATADGDHATNDKPTRLVFSTTADGASSPTERMRIDRNGRFYVPGVWDYSTSGGTTVVVTSDDQIRKAASSIKYKTQVEDLEDAYADQILNIRPVWYRSLCDGDDPSHSYWGFIAEEVAEIDPRLTTWKFHDVSYDENGSRVVTKLDNPEPEGVAYDRFVPHLLNLIKRQKEQIETQSTAIAALEARLTAALQEALAEIESLKARVTALEP